MNTTYWMSEPHRKWGVLKASDELRMNESSSRECRVGFPSARDLMKRLECSGFILVTRMEYLLLIEALAEKNISVRYSSRLPERVIPEEISSVAPSRETFDLRDERKDFLNAA